MYLFIYLFIHMINNDYVLKKAENQRAIPL